MKKTSLTISLIFLSISLFTGCSSKYQTNKLPDEENINLPKKVEKKRYYLNAEIREDFKTYVINEFNHGIIKKETKEQKNGTSIPKNIWFHGYEIDKKRY